MPDGMTPPMPQGGTGAATAPKPMMGAAAQAMALVRAGLEALQKSLGGLPMGSEIHTAVLKAVIDVSRRLEKGSDGDNAASTQALAQMARENQAQPQQAAAMARMMPGGPGGPPPPPPPGA